MKITSLIIGMLLSTFALVANDLEAVEKGSVFGQVYVNNEENVASFAEVVLDGTSYSVTTNADGSFHLAGVPSGEYQLTIHLSDKEVADLGTITVSDETSYKLKCIVFN